MDVGRISNSQPAVMAGVPTELNLSSTPNGCYLRVYSCYFNMRDIGVALISFLLNGDVLK
ncbi:hypothetical protein J6590_067437 [Homalodisca vitripennis]|nr:hypothetical protein J6590_067437 [Homalodisca vitripennis]